MESRTRICVFDYATTPDEAVPGAGSIRRMITRENSGMNLTLSKGTLKPGAGMPGMRTRRRMRRCSYLKAREPCISKAMEMCGTGRA